MNAFLLIFGAVVLAVGVAAGRYFAGGQGLEMGQHDG